MTALAVAMKHQRLEYFLKDIAVVTIGCRKRLSDLAQYYARVEAFLERRTP